MRSVETLHDPDQAAFERYTRRGIPVRITGALEKCLRVTWDLEYLAATCGDARVPVERYPTLDSRIGGWQVDAMPFREFLAKMGREQVYVCSVSLGEHLPQL